MREILFRGKTKDEANEWIESCNINTQYDMYGEKHIFIGLHYESKFYPLQKSIVWKEVIPETVGQYTGLTDNNGNKIFEGDIVKWYSELVVVKFGEYDAIEQSYEIGNHFRKVDKFGWFGERQSCCSKGIEFILLKDGEVIGNIHDNPELLEESNEKQTK